MLILFLLLENGGRVNIEIQVLQAPHHTIRILFYLSKMINDQMKSGGKYSQLGRTISISILNYKLFPENCQYKNIFTLYDNNSHTTFADLLEVVTLELPKLPEQYDNTAIFPWLKFINLRDKEDAMDIIDKYPHLRETYDELQLISQDESRYYEYETRMKWWRDEVNILEWREEQEAKAIARGEAIGLERGLEQEKHLATIETARTAKKMNIPLENIVELTGLSVEEIDCL